MNIPRDGQQKASPLRYQRILLKLGGEALSSSRGYGIDAEMVRRIAAEVKRVHDLGIEVAVVIGGGDMWVWGDAAGSWIDSATAGYVCVFGTVMNFLGMTYA